MFFLLLLFDLRGMTSFLWEYKSKLKLTNIIPDIVGTGLATYLPTCLTEKWLQKIDYFDYLTESELN